MSAAELGFLIGILVGLQLAAIAMFVMRELGRDNVKEWMAKNREWRN